MQNTNQPSMLSVKELNEVLEKFQNKEELSTIGTFSEVDIVFVAGMFLWYMQHKNDWKKIPKTIRGEDWICLSANIEKKRDFVHSNYFKQIYKLYNVSHNQIFENFPNPESVKGKYKADIYSSDFVPPIYITEENLDCFFRDKIDNNIEYIKNKYKNKFDILDFVLKGKPNYKNSKDKFTKYAEEIKDRLDKYPAIFTFVFIVASKNLAIKKNESFDQRKNYVEKLWLFTQDYVRGLYELAKNIVEHSGKDGLKGEGMITIRAYSENRINKVENKVNEIKILETHVFDYGKKGIVPKLIEYTKEKATGNDVKNQEIKKCYIDDKNFFTNNVNYELENLISPQKGKELKQQKFRHTSHYGINKLHKLITKTLTSNDYRSEMLVSSKGQTKRDTFGNNAENLTLKNGTHYYFKIPFAEGNFNNIAPKLISQKNQTAILGETASLEALSKITKIPVNINQLSKVSQTIENSLIDITVDIRDKEITKENVDRIYKSLDKLTELNDNNKIAINLQNKITDASVLLRFLSYLTFEYKQPFIVYNVDYDIYKTVLADNKDFYDSRKPSEAYWHEERALLLFVKTQIVEKTKKEEEKIKDFYFADILYGLDRDTFLFVNNIASKTFPNTITLLQEIDDKQKNTKTNYIEHISSNQNLQQFFYPETNTLYPFDVLLEDNDKPLFVSNLTTILQNPLIRSKQDYSNLKEYIENFDGFRITETHFKIGTKIHSEDFYYAKRLFQNSFYTTRLAMLLAIRIKNKINEINGQIEEENKQKEDKDKKQKIDKITLVGYEMYSELLLSLIEKFLKDFGYKTNEQNKEEKINHFVTTTQSDDANFKFLPNDTFSTYLKKYKNRCTIIIVPIASTGSTANKIEKDIREQIYKQEKNTNNKSRENAKIESEKYDFFAPRYNILLAQPENGFEKIKMSNKNQEEILKIPAVWHEIKNCSLCYGVDKEGNSTKAQALFEADKSSLTPALIFENPKGKELTEDERRTFNTLEFKDSLKYTKVFRNNNYRIYSIDSDKYIENNLPKIKNWLKNKVKQKLNLNFTDKIVIIAPCHESNSQFLNLVNEIVFYSSATIIHYQNNVDYDENFKLLNKNYLNKETKLFYVDDSLITGKHFYEVFDLINDNSTFTGSIFLKDKSMPDTHNRIVKMSGSFFTLANFNQPPALNLLEQRPLEHEKQRYETLSKTALHDATIEIFQQKANSLNPQKLNNKKENTKDKDKEIRRLKCFEATHKIYDYFSVNPQKEDYDIESIVSFKEYSSPVITDLFPKYSREVEKKKAEERKDNPKALLKVLSQYPFILYQPLKKKTFDWLNVWLNEIQEPNKNCFIQTDYDNFQTIKFLLRRAVLLGNYQVLETKFLQKILSWFIKIDKYFKEKSSTSNTSNLLSKNEEDNLLDFPIYVLRNYVEMIQKNGWVAYHIKTNVQNLKAELSKSKQGSQFLFMLQIESALVIDDFYGMILQEKRLEWRDLFKNHKKLNIKTDEIFQFFEKDTNKNILDSNKYLIVKETFLDKADEWIKQKPTNPFINYLWIKQLLFVDCDKDSHFPRNEEYQTKIDAIIGKMKEFFLSNKNVQAFFIVTDGQHKPYVLKDEQNLLNNFCLEFEDSAKTNHKTQMLINFLKGNKCSTDIAFETTAGYYRNRCKKEIEDDFYKNTANQKFEILNQDLFSNPAPNYDLAKWTDAYNKIGGLDLPFMPSDSKWLFLIRITKRDELTEKFDTLGMLGFYSTENLYNSPDSLLPKQLLMLLRKDMGKFIEKHHKNDEFSLWIQQKEKADYQIMLKHGIGTYDDAIQYYQDLIEQQNDESDVNLMCFLNAVTTWITGRTILLGILSELEKNYRDDYNYETPTVKDLIDSINKIWKYILCFYRQGLEVFLDTTISEVDSFIKLVDNTSELDKRIDFTFPEKLKEQIIFEVFYNIRKHVLKPYYRQITTNVKKVEVELSIKQIDNTTYFTISNNYCCAEIDEQEINRKKIGNKEDGLNLIYNILHKIKIGEMFIELQNTSSVIEKKKFIINIPLKHS
jgi:hypothetical protein